MEKLSEQRLKKIGEMIRNPPPHSKFAAAKEFGVDLTLLFSQLNLTPQQRIEEAQVQMTQLENLREQIRFQNVQRPKNLKPTVIEVFAESKVQFVVVGEIVAFIYDLPRGSFAFEICYARRAENVKQIVVALAPYNPLPRGFTTDSSFEWNEQILSNEKIIRLKTELGNIDLLAEVEGIGDYEKVKAESTTNQVSGVDVNILSIKGLLQAKKAAGCPKDLLVIPELEALQEALSEE